MYIYITRSLKTLENGDEFKGRKENGETNLSAYGPSFSQPFCEGFLHWKTYQGILLQCVLVESFATGAKHVNGRRLPSSLP